MLYYHSVSGSGIDKGNHSVSRSWNCSCPICLLLMLKMLERLRIALEFDKHKIFWEEPKKNLCKGPILQYDGVPFVIRSSTTLECQFGRDRHVARKRKTSNEFSPGMVLLLPYLFIPNM